MLNAFQTVMTSILTPHPSRHPAAHVAPERSNGLTTSKVTGE